jgi:phage recombination protein Bet
MNTQVEKQEKPMEFIPYGAADKIRLTLSIIQNIVAVPTKSGKTCSERDAMKFMMLCQAQRLNPFAGDAFLVGYDTQSGPSFSLITAHQAFLKRAETNEDFDGMTSGILIRNEDDSITEREGDFHLSQELDNVVGGWAKVFHKKRQHPTYRKVRMARFNKGFAQWKEDPAGMIVKCAEADALRSTFPTLLGGLYTLEENNISTTVTATVPEGVRLNVAPPEANQAQIEGTPLADPKKRTPQDELELLVIQAGHDFNLFQKFGESSGNLPDASSLSSFDEVPAELAKRLLKNQAGFLKALEGLKG